MPFPAELYPWIKALHIIAVIAWMAGMLYLPRLFVYHTDAAPGSDKAETFKVMERRLLRLIMTPAMIAAWVFGLVLLWGSGGLIAVGWMHAKLLLVVVLSGLHGWLAGQVKVFARDANKRPAKFWRMMNEAPTVLMVAIVILAVVKPF
jgi:putative membrane protein